MIKKMSQIVPLLYFFSKQIKIVYILVYWIIAEKNVYVAVKLSQKIENVTQSLEETLSKPYTINKRE